MATKEKAKKSAPKPEEVPRKKIVYLEIDDEVTAAYDKIRALPAKDIYLVAPQQAALFQSIVNLKILKRKAADEGKTIYFITNDPNGMYLAEQVGITVYDRARDDDKPSLFSTELSDEKLRITPLSASVNSVEEETPTRLTERKLSISELLKRKRTISPVKVAQLEVPVKQKKAMPKLVLIAPNRHVLISLVVVTVFILMVIVYIALPGVTIHITPSASVLEKSVNITLADYQKNKAELDTRPPHMIASYPLNTTVSKTITYTSTGKRFSEQGAHATGTLTIYNHTNAAQPLIPRTRFQTDEGIVFRVSTHVNVPAATSAGPGVVDVFVVADPLDAHGQVVGARGNLGPTKFFLPGLKESTRSKIYAENKEPLSGGVTDFVSFVTAEDVEAARAKLTQQLKESALGDLRVAVKEQGSLIGDAEAFTLLEGDGAVKMGEIVLSVPPDLSGREVKEFSLSGEVKVSGVYYDHAGMLEILKNELIMKKSPQKELARINEQSTSYRIFQWDEAAGKIKLTANIKGIEQFNLDMEQESGARLLKKIKDHIVGKDIKDAELFIQNLPEVNKVRVESWPAWAPTIPSISDNIKFEIHTAVNAE